MELLGLKKRCRSPSVGSPSEVAATDPLELGSWDGVVPEPVGDVESHKSLHGIPSLEHEHEKSSTAAISNDVRIPQMHTQQTGVVTALSLLRTSKRIKMPWEKGPLAPVFNREPVMKRFAVKPCAIGLADVLSPEPKRSVQPSAIPVGTIAAPQDLVKRRIAMTSYNIQEDELRSRALNKFKVLVSLDPHATKIGRSMLDALGRLEDNDTMMHILSDSLATKATGTLTKRASALWRWANWLAESRMGTCFRQTEANVYKYMNFLREQGYAPTAASHFLEALGFAHQVFTLCHMNPSTVLTSRVKGAAHSMFLQKRKLKQAPAFSVEAVRAFETMVLQDPRDHIKVICGSILFCILACIRWTDAMRIENVQLDRFSTILIVEASTSRHKTSMSKEHKTRLLPYTATGRFLSKAFWADSWFAARKDSGLENGLLFLPSWNEVSGTWSKQPMSSGEATCWIREILHMCDIGQCFEVSSHSCKCTLLTWAGMCNVFTREERTLLGHHVEPQTKASTTYSRDAQILLQYKVMKVLTLIDTGRLKPDASRAERLSMLISHDEGNDEPSVEQEIEPQIEESEDESDDCDHEEVGHLQSGLDDMLEAVRDAIPEEDDDYLWYIHCFTGVVHVAVQEYEEQEVRLACGRALTTNLIKSYANSAEVKCGLFCIQCNSVVKKFNEQNADPGE